MAVRIWHRFYDEDVPLEIEAPADPLFLQLEKTAREFPQVVATDFMGARLTYRQLAEQVKQDGRLLWKEIKMVRPAGFF